LKTSTFIKKYKLQETDKKCIRHYRKGKDASYYVIKYPDGTISGEIYRNNEKAKFVELTEDEYSE